MKTKILMTLALAVSLSFSAAYAQKPGYRHNEEERDRYGYKHQRNNDYKRNDARELARQRWELQKMSSLAVG